MKEPRDIIMRIRVSESEYSEIYQQFEKSGCRSLSAYVRKVSAAGFIVNMDESCFEKLIKLTGNLTNNMNQIARRVNSTGRIYAEDIAELKGKVEEVWQQQLSMQSLLQKLRR